MVLQLFMGLMMLAFVSLLITQGRRRRIWSVLLLAGLAVVSYFFMESLNNTPSSGFIYQWLPYDMLKADFNISSSLRTQKLIHPLIILLGALVYVNTLFHEEKHSLHINTLMLLNFVALILLISSHDFLQLMFADCALALLSFYIADFPKAKKVLFVFNFLSEMLIFTLLAIVYGKTGSISLSRLPDFVSNGEHQNFTTIILLLAIGCKTGLFLLNGQYFDLKYVSLNRLGCLLTLSIPFSGLIILAKLKPMIADAAWISTLITCWCDISVATALLAALINKDVRSKNIAFCLTFYAIALRHIYANQEYLYTQVPYFLYMAFLICLSTIMTVFGSSGETDVSRLGGFWRLTKLNFLLSLIIAITLTSLCLKIEASTADKVLLGSVMAVFVLNLNSTYLGKSRADEKVSAFAQSVGILYWLPLLCFLYWLMWKLGTWNNVYYYKILVVMLVVMLLAPVKIFIKLGNIFSWQDDILLGLYEMIFIRPLKFLGRILWLAFDVVMIERNIIGGVSSVMGVVVEGLHRLQDGSARGFLLSMSIGIIAMLIYFGSLFYE